MKQTRQTNYPGLTEKEARELEVLDNPQVEIMAPVFSVFPALVGRSLFNPRRRKVIKIRVKMRCAELNINKKDNPVAYNKIVEEEQKRFDERFKNK